MLMCTTFKIRRFIDNYTKAVSLVVSGAMVQVSSYLLEAFIMQAAMMLKASWRCKWLDHFINSQTNKRTNKQTNKQTRKQTNKQTKKRQKNKWRVQKKSWISPPSIFKKKKKKTELRHHFFGTPKLSPADRSWPKFGHIGLEFHKDSEYRFGSVWFGRNTEPGSPTEVTRSGP